MDFVRDRDSRVYTTAFHFATMTVTTVGYGDTSSATQAAMVVVTVFVVFRAIFSYIVAIERQHDERGCTRRRGEERPGAGEAVVSAGMLSSKLLDPSRPCENYICFCYTCFGTSSDTKIIAN